MKYTIEGFSQKYALTLKKEVVRNGKSVTVKIDCTDLVILRWFVDFYPNMQKCQIEGKEYAWVSYYKMIKELPLIDITKRSFADRMKKLVEFGLLEYRYDETSLKAFYGFGKNYVNLVEEPNTHADEIEGMQSIAGGVCNQLQGGYAINCRGGMQSTAPYSSINNYSIIYNNKKERKESQYDSILAECVSDEEVRKVFIEFIKMRSMIKKPMTNEALKLTIAKLEKMSKGNPKHAVAILNQSIVNNWKDIFELKDGYEEQVNDVPKKKNKLSDFEVAEIKDKLYKDEKFRGLLSEKAQLEFSVSGYLFKGLSVPIDVKDSLKDISESVSVRVRELGYSPTALKEIGLVF